MTVRHTDKKLERMEYEQAYYAGFSANLVTMYRKRMQFIRAAADERDFYNLKSPHYEKLKGKRQHQRSMRLNDQFRLILEIHSDASGKLAVIVSLDDYH